MEIQTIWSRFSYTSGLSLPFRNSNNFSLVNFFQVTVEAITDCLVLQMDEDTLEKNFENAPNLRIVLDSLIGHDVAKKLYAVSDVANMGAQANHEQAYGGNGASTSGSGRPLRVLNFRKTASMDAIHTGGKGHVRSNIWIQDANLKQFQNGKIRTF